jgi:hypothetical protein
LTEASRAISLRGVTVGGHRCRFISLLVAAGVVLAMPAPPSLAAPGSDTTIVSSTFILGAESSAGQVFGCSPGRALGGGVSSGPTSGAVAEPQVNGPLGPSGTSGGTSTGQVPGSWFISTRNSDSTFDNDVVLYALCSQNSDAVVEAGAPTLLTALQAFSFLVPCPSGTRAIGGGIGTTAGTPASRILLTAPIDETGSTVTTTDGDIPVSWFTRVQNNNDASRTYIPFAVCSPASDAVIEVTDVNIPNGDLDGAVAACPPGRRAVSGGVGHLGGIVQNELRSSHPVDETLTVAGTQSGDVARGWRADVVNATGSPLVHRVMAVCVSDPPAAPAKKKCKKKKKKGKRAGPAAKKRCKKSKKRK